MIWNLVYRDKFSAKTVQIETKENDFEQAKRVAVAWLAREEAAGGGPRRFGSLARWTVADESILAPPPAPAAPPAVTEEGS